MFTPSRDEARRFLAETWNKFRAGQPLSALERIAATIIAEHPEYHALLDADAVAVEAEFLPEAGVQNPFLHLGLHLTIREQVSTDRPPGIRALHASLTLRLGSVHEAEHRMLEVLGELLWESQRAGTMPDEMLYLERLKNLADSTG